MVTSGSAAALFIARTCRSETQGSAKPDETARHCDHDICIAAIVILGIAKLASSRRTTVTTGCDGADDAVVGVGVVGVDVEADANVDVAILGMGAARGAASLLPLLVGVLGLVLRSCARACACAVSSSAEAPGDAASTESTMSTSAVLLILRTPELSIGDSTDKSETQQERNKRR